MIPGTNIPPRRTLARRIALALSLLAAIAAPPARAHDELIELSARPQAALKAVVTRDPAAAPSFVAILLPGGTGSFRFAPRDGGGITMTNEARLPNRLRPLLLARGIATYMVDAPSDVPALSDAFRAGREHAADLEAVLDDASRRFPGVPRILVGHSNGTLSAAHFAAGGANRVEGVALVAGRFAAVNYSDRFFDSAGLGRFDWGAIRIPLLILHHAKDDCFATPFAAAAALAERYPAFAFRPIDPAGSTATGKCGYDGTHNLAGQEPLVADAVARWADANVKLR